MPSRKKKSVTKLSAKKKGRALLNQVVKMSGIPSKNIKDELKLILEKKNIDIDQLTLEQLRSVVASYFREIMGGFVDKYHAKRNESRS